MQRSIEHRLIHVNQLINTRPLCPGVPVSRIGLYGRNPRKKILEFDNWKARFFEEAARIEHFNSYKFFTGGKIKGNVISKADYTTLNWFTLPGRFFGSWFRGSWFLVPVLGSAWFRVGPNQSIDIQRLCSQK